jgi:hypothetical protein
MEQIPLYADIAFMLTLAATIFLFYRATNKSVTVLIVLFLWMLVQGILTGVGFYTSSYSLPPRMLAALIPPLACITYLLVSRKGRMFIDSLNPKTLTLLHIIRIPVEIVLLWLFIYKGIPQIMTFEGRNFDIMSGVSAPIIYYFAFAKGRTNKALLLIWNFVCLLLLINIVTIAILSTPYPFQKFGLNQPNIAIFYLPYIWLPSVIVPVVLFAHLASLKQLLAGSAAGRKLPVYSTFRQ